MGSRRAGASKSKEYESDSDSPVQEAGPSQRDTSSADLTFEERVNAMVEESLRLLVAEQPDIRPEHDASQVSGGPVDIVSAKKGVQRHARRGSSLSVESGCSGCDKFKRKNKVVSTKKKHKSHKRRRCHSSSSFTSSSSSQLSSDPKRLSTKQDKFFTRSLKLKVPDRGPTVRVRTVMREGMEGLLNTYRLLNVIAKAAARYLGVKCAECSFLRELDQEVEPDEWGKRYETTVCNLRSAILSSLMALSPLINRVGMENSCTSLATEINDGLEVVCAAAAYAGYHRCENLA